MKKFFQDIKDYLRKPSQTAEEAWVSDELNLINKEISNKTSLLDYENRQLSNLLQRRDRLEYFLYHNQGQTC